MVESTSPIALGTPTQRGRVCRRRFRLSTLYRVSFPCCGGVLPFRLAIAALLIGCSMVWRLKWYELVAVFAGFVLVCLVYCFGCASVLPDAVRSDFVGLDRSSASSTDVGDVTLSGDDTATSVVLAIGSVLQPWLVVLGGGLSYLVLFRPIRRLFSRTE